MRARFWDKWVSHLFTDRSTFRFRRCLIFTSIWCIRFSPSPVSCPACSQCLLLLHPGQLTPSVGEHFFPQAAGIKGEVNIKMSSCMPTAPPHPHPHPTTSPAFSLSLTLLFSRCLVIYQSNEPQIHLPLIFRFILKVSMFNWSHFSRCEENLSSLTSNNLTHCKWLFIDSIKDSLMQVNKFAPLFHSHSSLSRLLFVNVSGRFFCIRNLSLLLVSNGRSVYLQLNTQVHRQEKEKERQRRVKGDKRSCYTWI